MTKQETKFQVKLTVKEFYRHYDAHGAFPLPEDFASVEAIMTPLVMLQYTQMSKARQGAFYNRLRSILRHDDYKYASWRISAPPNADALTPKQIRKRAMPAVENAARQVVALREQVWDLYARFDIADDESEWVGPSTPAIEMAGWPG